MSEELLLQIGRNAVWTALQVSAPMLLIGLLAGLAVSLLQAVTQIQEATLSFIPKIVGVALAFLVFMPWMIHKVVAFTLLLLGDFRGFIQ